MHLEIGTDPFCKKKPESFSDLSIAGEDDRSVLLKDLLPSPVAGPEALYARDVLLDELALGFSCCAGFCSADGGATEAVAQEYAIACPSGWPTAWRDAWSA